MTFHGKVALITGAGSGMGQLAARNLAAEGALVAALDVNERGLADTAEGLPGIRTIQCDVTDAKAVAAAVREAERELGPIDRLYAAAGIMRAGPLLAQPLEDIHASMRINYFGVVNITLAVVPAMLERGRGDVVHFASFAGWVPMPGLGAYNASKFAVVAFSEVLWHENRGKGLRLTCVCPPAVDTPMLNFEKRPKMFDYSPRLRPEAVLVAIEKALERGRLWCMPGRATRLQWYLRRFAPGLMWRGIHFLE